MFHSKHCDPNMPDNNSDVVIVSLDFDCNYQIEWFILLSYVEHARLLFVKSCTCCLFCVRVCLTIVSSIIVNDNVLSMRKSFKSVSVSVIVDQSVCCRDWPHPISLMDCALMSVHWFDFTNQEPWERTLACLQQTLAERLKSYANGLSPDFGWCVTTTTTG